MSINLSYYSIFSSGLDQGGAGRRVFRAFGALPPLLKASGKALSMRRSELYQNVCSNRPARMEERWYAGTSVRVGTHCLADLPIYNWELFIYNSFN